MLVSLHQLLAQSVPEVGTRNGLEVFDGDEGDSFVKKHLAPADELQRLLEGHLYEVCGLLGCFGLLVEADLDMELLPDRAALR